MNVCILSGRLGKDVELKEVNNGTTLGRFSLAVNTGYGDKKKTSWFNCIVWGKAAESMEKWCKKGTLVNINAEAVQNSYTNKDGNKVNSIEFNVRSWEFGGSKKDNEDPAEEKKEESNSAVNDFMSMPEDIDEELPFS